MSRIELSALRKEFGNVVAVNNLDLTIEDGEFIVLVGPSGCGKTTTLRMIAGFEDPTAGEIRVDGRVVNEMEPRDRDLGMVFQDHALFPHKTVAENIEFGLRMQKLAPAVRQQKLQKVAGLVRITHLLDKMPAQCSGGESQRVALARTLVTEPSNFLLDEPLSSLDAKLRREMRAECDRLHGELQKTFVYVTHDQEEAMTLADRIVVMRAGRIEQIGTPMEIYSSPVNQFVADFFGSPSMNLIEGSLEHKKGHAWFRTPRFSVELPDRFAQAEAGPVTLGIRPEHVTIGEAGQFDDTIQLIAPLGKDTLIYFDIEHERPLVVIVEGLQMQNFNVGSTVGVTFSADNIYLFAPDGRRIDGNGL
ncbi:MAG: ABC transporter ATP-binding protein [Gammaproteobacteria bacterium]|nr:ABC transporter ATP-binding protein [Gammaproteobacteria bacterium]MDH3410960.1 ABC transporter ATP-binding protein [Gammaproteobacteria bacterium]